MTVNYDCIFQDESLIPRESPHATLNGDINIINGSESSFTDNNAANKLGANSNSSGERASPPVLPSFADMLPPPPLYPPPGKDYQTSPRNAPVVPQGHLVTMPRMGAASAQPPCHTCQRGYHGGTAERPRAHFMLDAHGRMFNPTLPHMHAYNGAPTYALGGGNEYHTTYPSVPQQEPYQPYNVCHSSDSHDYAEPHFDCSRGVATSNANIYGGVPPMNPAYFHHQFQHPQAQMVHQKAVLPHQHSMPAHIQPQQQGAAAAPPAGRHHSIPSSEHSHELCMSCAEQTEYEEPWSDQPLPMMWNPNQHPHPHHPHPHQQQQQHQDPQLGIHHGLNTS